MKRKTNIEDVMFKERSMAFYGKRKKNKIRIILFSILIFAAIYILGLFFMKTNAISQWDKESKLYIQGYLDGKYEVLDSIKNK